jgi:hypothetical protein
MKIKNLNQYSSKAEMTLTFTDDFVYDLTSTNYDLFTIIGESQTKWYYLIKLSFNEKLSSVISE